jgi:hypothetical protein
MYATIRAAARARIAERGKTTQAARSDLAADRRMFTFRTVDELMNMVVGAGDQDDDRRFD